MSWQRFYLTIGLDIEQPYPGGHKTHYDQDQPVLVDTEGSLYPLIRDRLRAEDGYDQPGRAAVLLRG